MKKGEKQKKVQMNQALRKSQPEKVVQKVESKINVVQNKPQPQPLVAKKTTKPRFPLTLAEIAAVCFSFAAMFAFAFPHAYVLGLVHTKTTTQETPVALVTTPAVKGEETNTVVALDGEIIEPTQNRYPVAVMIDNHSGARPQSNLQQASLVYEALVEGSITRFMAVFDKGTQDKIGPIRSSRPYFLVYWDAIDGPYMHAGGSPEALLKIRQFDIKDVNMGKYYWRATDRPAPHNLYTSSDKQLFMLRDMKWDQIPKTYSTWNFSDNPTPGTDVGAGVDLYFSGKAEGSHVRFSYDAESQTYKRFQAGAEHLDAATNKQLAAQTVIVTEISPIVAIGDHGRLTLDVTGEGKAHVLFNGKRIEGTWKKSDSSVRERFYDSQGSEITFPRGPIWIEVIPSDHQVTFE